METFDSFAHDYEGNLSHPVRTLLGISSQSLLAQKIEQVRDALSSAGGVVPNLNLLDYGCGTGDFLSGLVAELDARAGLGLDVSGGMIAEAERRNIDDKTVFITAAKLDRDISQGSFDVAVASSVLHHVNREDWAGLFVDVFGLLKREGRLVIIEHNPRNPLTQLVVKTTAVDKGVSLLKPSELRQTLDALGLVMSQGVYFSPLPPKWKGAKDFDRKMRSMPFGAQWISVVTRSQ